MEKRESTIDRPELYYQANSLQNHCYQIFESFKRKRRPFEDVWIKCWRNYLGEYNPDTKWRKQEGLGKRSKLFIKLTALKCHTAQAKIMEVGEPHGGIAFELEAMQPERFGIDLRKARELVAFHKDRIKAHYQDIELPEIYAERVLELAILGTAVIKGPILEHRLKYELERRMFLGIPVEQIDPTMSPFQKVPRVELLPMFEGIPLWEYYVDPYAKHPRKSIAEIHFTRKLPAEVRALAFEASYDREAVFDACKRVDVNDENDFTYVQLGDNYAGEDSATDEKVSLLEYHGQVPVHGLRSVQERFGFDLPDNLDDEQMIEAQVVLAGDGMVIKAMPNPGGKRPFYVCPYKKRPNSICGYGVAESMMDSQALINSSVRLIIDNKRLSGNGMVGINIDRIDIKRTKDLKVYPEKTWFVKGAFKPSEAIEGIKFDDITAGLRELMEFGERFADEESGIPKYTHAETGKFLNKTATGMSMLMGMANLNLKPVMKNVDDFWTEPITEDVVEWFNDFGRDSTMKLPMKVKAVGTDSLVAKEIRLEHIMNFLNATKAPHDAIIMDRPKALKEAARLLDIHDIVRSDDEIKVLLQQMAEMASTPKDVREMVDLDKLFPFLFRNEQNQILRQLGIEPDEAPPAAGLVRDPIPEGATAAPSKASPPLGGM